MSTPSAVYDQYPYEANISAFSGSSGYQNTSSVTSRVQSAPNGTSQHSQRLLPKGGKNRVIDTHLNVVIKLITDSVCLIERKYIVCGVVSDQRTGLRESRSSGHNDPLPDGRDGGLRALLLTQTNIGSILRLTLLKCIKQTFLKTFVIIELSFNLIHT